MGGGGRDAGRIARAVAEEHEAARARRPRVELPEPPRRRVPRVHELALPARALLFVQALETLEGQVDLAADLEAFRESVPPRARAEWNGWCARSR